MAHKGLKWLVNVNNFLEQFPGSIVNFFDNLKKFIDNKPQAYVDQCCIWAATKVNRKIEKVRQQVISKLYDQYVSNTVLGRIANAVTNFLKNPLGAVASFFDLFLGPLKEFVEFTIELAKEVIRLAKNLKNIAEIPNKITPPNPNINFDAFSANIHIQSISVGEVLMGPAAFVPPETLYPDVPSPFDISSFKKKFDDAPEKKKEDSIVFKLKKQKEEVPERYRIFTSDKSDFELIENRGNLTPDQWLKEQESLSNLGTDVEDELKGYFN